MYDFLLQGIQSYLATDGNLLTNLGFSTISALLGTEAFLNLTVEEFLWGYEDKLVKVANRYIPSWIDFETFGLFERVSNKNELELCCIIPTLYCLYLNM